MKILHITDFHFRNDDKYKYEQDKVTDALSNVLSESGITPNFVMFTGDLVHEGSSADNFNEAKKILIDKIHNNNHIAFDRIFICPGNHDAYLNQEMQAIRTEIDLIKSVEDLDAFSNKDDDRQFLESLKNFQLYEDFQDSFYDEYKVGDDNDEKKPLYTIHKRNVDNKNIGIACINTAWRSFDSSKDKGNLVYPITRLKEIAQKLKNVDFKIILMHHAISDFKEYIETEMEDIIFNDFHVLLSGHYHKQKASTHIMSDEGIFCNVAPSALCVYDSHSSIGFTILDIDTETFEIDISIYEYDSSSHTFRYKETVSADIPLNSVKRQQNDIRKTIRKRYKEKVEDANSKFLINTEDKKSKTFLSMFTNPVLKTETKVEIVADTKKDSNSINIERDLVLSDENYMIYGKDKSGKTSLLWKIDIDILKQYADYKIISIYIDCNEYKNKKVDIITLLRRHLEKNTRFIGDLLSKYQLKLLIDNYDPEAKEFNQSVANFLEEYPKSRYIVCASETLFSSYANNVIFGQQCKVLFFHELTRKEIRTLTEKWDSIPDNRQTQVIDKIIKILAQLNLPINPWNVSLFLWIFEKTNEANFHNNFELIQLYIDGLLERANFTTSRVLKLDYDDFKIFLGELAYFLLTEHNDNNYTATFREITDFTDEYREKKRKFATEVKDVIDYVLNKGILIKNRDDDKYGFRLNGVFEYFLSYYMKDNFEFVKMILTDDHFYLSFTNELELYSGFNKRDSNFVDRVFEKTRKIFCELLSNANPRIDQQLISKIVFNKTLTQENVQIIAEKADVLLPSEQDDLMDNAIIRTNTEEGIKQKTYYQKIETNFGNLERALYILCRVFRNSSINDSKKEDEILDFILLSLCNLGLLLIDEANRGKDDDIDLENGISREDILHMIASIMPIMIQGFLFDALMQNNLERIIEDKINELKQDAKNNQLKLFALFFILVDLNPSNNRKYISQAISLITIPVLKRCIWFKAISYLMFNAHNDSEFEKFLRSTIRSQAIDINSNIDVNRLDEELSTQKRIIHKKNM